MKKRYRQRLLWIGILLLSMVLRFHLLDNQSFWNDEGNTARLVERTLPLIIKGAAGDIHPPGYYLLLYGWRTFTGDSEFALRGFSAFCGILTVVFATAIGQYAGGTYTALGAALVTALHPLSVYYSQEARMYGLLGLASAATLWAGIQLVKALEDGEIRSKRAKGFKARLPIKQMLFLSLCVTLGLYTQYTYVFGLVGLNLAFGLWWFLHQRWNWRSALIWAVAHAIGGLAFVPWAPIAMGASDWRPPDLEASQAFQEMARTLLVGITLPLQDGQYILIIGGILALLAFITTILRTAKAPVHPGQVFASYASAAIALMPMVIIIILGIYRPAYLKFLMISVVPLAVWITQPLSFGKRGQKHIYLLSEISGLLLLALFFTQINALQHLYYDPTYARNDYRGIANQLVVNWEDGDAVLLNAPNQWEVFTYYYQGPAPVYPAPYHPSSEDAATWVQDIVAQHQRLSVLYWGDVESDPQHLIAAELARQAYKTTDTWIGTIRLAEYGTAPFVTQAMSKTTDIKIGDYIQLMGYDLPRATYAPGEIIPLTLYWKVETAPGEHLKVFVHLLDTEGQLKAQHDGEPLNGFFPTYLWESGTELTDRYGVNLPPGLEPGNYALTVGMYRFSGERLPIQENGQVIGDAYTLETLTIE